MYALRLAAACSAGAGLLLAQCRLQALCRLLQLALQGLHLLGNILQLLLGDQAGLGHLMRFAIRFPDRRPNSYCHAGQLIFSSHRALHNKCPPSYTPKSPQPSTASVSVRGVSCFRSARGAPSPVFLRAQPAVVCRWGTGWSPCIWWST